jgi:hypothetical protein
MTALTLLTCLTPFLQRIEPEEMRVRVAWRFEPEPSLREHLHRMAAEVWCLLAGEVRADCEECPTCGHPLVTTITGGRRYLECLSPVHFTIELGAA